MRRWPIAASLLALAAVSCRGLDGAAVGFDRERVRAEVQARLRAFEAAERTLDPDALLAFLDPEFTMLQDGRRVSRAETAAQMRSTLPALRAFTPRFDDVEILVLGADGAVTSMLFHDVLTDARGVTTRMWGPSTLVWRKRGADWRVVFADSDHHVEAP